jgi:epoxide hydrolase-like predicted phosphatase
MKRMNGMENNKEKTPVYKRVLAWIGIVILVGMYLFLLFEALTGSPETYNVFLGCVAATVAIPILLWLLIWSIGALTGRHTVASLDPMTSNKRHDRYGNVIPDSEVDTVVFDIGNVLVNFAWEKFLEDKGFDKAMVERIGKATVFSDDWIEYDRGDLTNQQIIERFAENDPEIGDDIRRAFTDLKNIVTRREETIPWIRSLKNSGYKVLVLSNFSKQAVEGCPDAMDFLSEVDGGILSYRDHVVKPYDDIYNLLMERYDLVPSRTVFIDDTPANIETAKRLGWHGIVYRERSQVLEELKGLGIS